MDFIHRLVSQDQKNENYRQKKTKNMNRSINKTSTYKPQKDQITNQQSNKPGHTHT
jgi:hypothetical protein